MPCLNIATSLILQRLILKTETRIIFFYIDRYRQLHYLYYRTCKSICIYRMVDMYISSCQSKQNRRNDKLIFIFLSEHHTHNVVHILPCCTYFTELVRLIHFHFIAYIICI